MVSVEAEGGVTRLVNLRQSGATKLIFPRQMTDSMEVILINTAGGVTGGDRFALQVDAAPGSHLTLTTQAAERAYRAQTGEVGHIATRLAVDAGARLDWLPQEMILFDGFALNRTLEIDLTGDAQVLMVEPLVFGRAAMGERLGDITLRDRIRIRRDGAPLYYDAVDLSGDFTTQFCRAALGNGAGAMASVVLVRPDAAARLPHVRAALPATGGASLLADDVLVLRLLAEDSFMLRRALVPILEHLSNRNLPTSWRL